MADHNEDTEDFAAINTPGWSALFLVVVTPF
jgi:hypothetical protein